MIKKPYNYIKIYHTSSLHKLKVICFCYDKKNRDGFHYYGAIQLRNDNTTYVSKILTEYIRLNLIKRPSILDKINCCD